MTEPTIGVLATRVQVLETGQAVLQSEHHANMKRIEEEVRNREHADENILRELADETSSRRHADDIAWAKIDKVYFALIAAAITVATSAVGVMLTLIFTRGTS